MKFKTLDIKNFKCFKERKFEFGDGLNIVFGPNESGKSTIYQALVLSLFGPNPTRKKHFGNLERDDFTPLNSDKKPSISLVFTRGDTTYRIDRDFAESYVSIIQNAGQSDENVNKLKIEAARDFIKDILGGIDEDIFQKYASINHAELSSLDSSAYKEENENMGRTIIKMVESRRGEGLLDVKKQLEKELKLTEGDKKAYQAQASNLEVELERLRIWETKLTSLKKEKSDISIKLDDNQKRWNMLSVVLENVNKRRNREKEINDLEKDLEHKNTELTRLREMLSQKEEITRSIGQFPGEIKEGFEKIKSELEYYYTTRNSVQAKLETVRDQIKRLKEDVEKSELEFKAKFANVRENLEDVYIYKEKYNEKQKFDETLRVCEREINSINRRIDEGKSIKRSNLNIVYIALPIAFVFFIVSLFASGGFVIASVFGIVIFLAVAGFFFYKSRSAFDESLIEKFQRKTIEIDDLESKRAQIDIYLAQVADKLGFSTRDDLDDLYNGYKQEESSIKFKNDQLKNYEQEETVIVKSDADLSSIKDSLIDRTGYKTLIDLENALDEFEKSNIKLNDIEQWVMKENTEKRIPQLESEIRKHGLIAHEMRKAFSDEFASEPINEEKYSLLNTEFSELNSQIKELTIQKNELDGEIRGRESEIFGSSEEMQEKLDRTVQLLNSIMQKNEEIAYLLNIVNTLGSEYQFKFLPELEKRALELFRNFAKNSDKSFSLENWPEIRIFSTSLEGFREKHLSQGTRDQLYFALRMSWSDILTPENLKLPLLWDDPFVHSDRDRTKNICEIAKILVQSGHQLVIFTHRDDLFEAFLQIFPKTEISQILL